MLYHLSTSSQNQKVGIGVAVSTSSNKTCPDNCGLKKVCYAKYGNLNFHWSKVSNGSRGVDWDTFVNQVSGLPKGTKFRHNQAGDLVGENQQIDRKKLNKLSKVIKERNLKAWTYTHKPVEGENLRAIRAAIKSGFIVNISADTLEQADSARKLNLPTVVVVPANHPEKFETPEGRRGIICPEQTGKVKSCSECLLCQKNRKIIIGFRAHGIMKKLV